MSKDIPILDLARAFAACWVMAAHISLIGGRPVFLLSQGSLGVEVFIFISGFLMTLILKDEAHVTWSGLGRFYLRRFFRIVPAFYAALLLYVAFRGFFTDGLAQAEAFFATPYRIAGLHDALSWRSVLLNVLFLHGLSPGEATKIFGPAWSLSLEMQFYAVAPLLVWCFRRQPFWTLAALFAVNLISNRLFGFYGHKGLVADFPYPAFLPNRIFLFFLGGSYCVYLFGRTRRNLSVFIAAAAGSLALVGWKSAVVCFVLVGIVHAAVVAKPPWRRVWDSLATSKPTHLLAEWSYGIYLFHMFCMALAGHLLTTLGAQVSQTAAFSIYVVVVVGSAVLLAACMHALVEKPARDFGKELSRRR